MFLIYHHHRLDYLNILHMHPLAQCVSQLLFDGEVLGHRTDTSKVSTQDSAALGSVPLQGCTLLHELRAPGRAGS